MDRDEVCVHRIPQLIHCGMRYFWVLKFHQKK